MKLPEEIIIETVLDHFDLKYEILKCRSRLMEYVKARYIIMYFCKQYTNLSLSTIGRIFNKDHCTVMFGVQQVAIQMEVNKDYRVMIERLDVILKSIGIFLSCL